jgi:hypothetical protein
MKVFIHSKIRIIPFTLAELVEWCTTMSRSCFDPPGRTQHEQRSRHFRTSWCPVQLGMEDSLENRLSIPLAPQSWGEMVKRWGTPPNPCQRGFTPFGIPYLVIARPLQAAVAISPLRESKDLGPSGRPPKRLYYLGIPIYVA